MVAVLTIEVALKIEALLVTNAVVHQRVETASSSVADVAVAAVKFTGPDVTLSIAMPIAHFAHAFRAAVVTVSLIEGAERVVTFWVAGAITYLKRCATIRAIGAIFDLTRAGVVCAWRCTRLRIREESNCVNARRAGRQGSRGCSQS